MFDTVANTASAKHVVEIGRPFSEAKRLKVLEEENAICRSFWLSDADPAAYGELLLERVVPAPSALRYTKR